MVAFHDEIRYLPGWFRNVPPQVDGVVALDDGSSDGSGDLARAQSSVLEVLHVPARSPHDWDESRNRRLLVEAAERHGADWVIAVDAEERLERGFRERAALEIATAERSGVLALAVHFRELWDAPDRWRADGIWGGKRFARFFASRPDPEIDPRRVHGHWAPLNSRPAGGFPVADLVIYHLRMQRESDRVARRAHHERLDPRNELQPIGYAYLTSPEGLRLEPLPPGREYEPMELS